MINRLLETVADIAYLAGHKGFYSGDSRADMLDFIIWAKDFEDIHKNTIWDDQNYMLAIEAFANEKLTSDKN